MFNDDSRVYYLLLGLILGATIACALTLALMDDAIQEKNSHGKPH